MVEYLVLSQKMRTAGILFINSYLLVMTIGNRNIGQLQPGLFLEDSL